MGHTPTPTGMCMRSLANTREEIFVVSGKLYDHTIKRWVGAGEYACRGPGQKHGPFECGPDEGASVLLINTNSWGKK